MKKYLALLLACIMVFALCVSSTAFADVDEALVEAAKAEGTVVVYGSCEEDYLNAACDKFEELYGIKVERQRLSTGEVPAKIEEENRKKRGKKWKTIVKYSKVNWMKLMI